MSQSGPGHLPTIPLDQSGLRSIDSIIKGYLPHLARKQPMPRRTIVLLRDIRRKLAPLLKPCGFPEGTALRLSRDELWVLDIAIQGFAALLSQRVASSEERDGTLTELDRLHRYYAELLSP